MAKKTEDTAVMEETMVSEETMNAAVAVAPEPIKASMVPAASMNFDMLSIPVEQLGPLAEFKSFTTPAEVKADMLEDMGIDEEFTRFSLPKLKVPSGGGSFWQIPGGTPAETVRGIILAKKAVKTFYIDPDAGNVPPDCKSEDGKRGVGIHRTDQEKASAYACVKCQYNKFGTDCKGGKGKACKDRLILAILTQDGIIPMMLNVPPTSLKKMNEFVMGVLNKHATPMHNIVVDFSLEETTNGKQTFSVVNPKFVSLVPAEAQAAMKNMRLAAKEILNKVPMEELNEEEEAENLEVVSF